MQFRWHSSSLDRGQASYDLAMRFDGRAKEIIPNPCAGKIRFSGKDRHSDQVHWQRHPCDRSFIILTEVSPVVPCRQTGNLDAHLDRP